ncbi:metallophosphoesterase [Streptomyces cirratus]
MVIAHLSDVHFDGGARATDRARAVMEYLDGLPYDLDAVLVSGDIADHGAPEEYDEGRKVLRSRHPLVICPGNHDERLAFRKGLLGEAEPTAEPVDQVVRGDGFVLAVCDSSVPGEHPGFLAESTLAWLDGGTGRHAARGARPGGLPHTRPSPCTSRTWTASGSSRGAARGARRAAPAPQGVPLRPRPHRAVTTFAGRPLLVAPGVVSTTRLPWEAQSGPDEHVHLDEPPVVAFHVLGEDGRLTTHYRVVVDRR